MLKNKILLTLLLIFNGCNTTNTNNKNNVKDAKKTPLIIIGINFKNENIINKDKWSDKIFNTDINSLNGYFLKTSNNNFYFEKVKETYNKENDGYIEVTLDYNHPNPDSILSDEYIKMESLAFEKALKYIPNIEEYDTNKDNELSRRELTIIFIVAGSEAATGSTENSVWANSNELRKTKYERFRLNNLTITAHFGLFGEYHNNKSYKATIGIIAHELTHAVFEAPDLYNTENGNYGIGPFGLMALGSWNSIGDNYPGTSPKELSAYFKVKEKWTEVNEILTEGKYIINDTNSINENILKMSINEKEYFLIENLSINGFDKGLERYVRGYKGGIAIWHIDENIIEDNLFYNKVNNDVNHKGIDLEEAKTDNLDNGKLPEYTDLYFNGNNNKFGNNTIPNNNKSYTNELNKYEIYDISNISEEMSLKIIKK